MRRLVVALLGLLLFTEPAPARAEGSWILDFEPLTVRAAVDGAHDGLNSAQVVGIAHGWRSGRALFLLGIGAGLYTYQARLGVHLALSPDSDRRYGWFAKLELRPQLACLLCDGALGVLGQTGIGYGWRQRSGASVWIAPVVEAGVAWMPDAAIYLGGTVAFGVTW